MTTALVLGGGAPNLSIMSGALLALDEAGAEFDAITTTGAGMLVGLLYAAPAQGDRQNALKHTIEMGVSDAIYQFFPVNYKVFYKYGEWAELYAQSMMPWLHALPTQTPMQRLWTDMVWFAAASMTPTSLNPMSQGLCQPPPWIDTVVDFDKLKDFDGDFFMSAYNLDESRMERFVGDDISARHFKAALAFPFIYAPYEVDGTTYIEGSAIDTLDFEALIEEKHLHVDTAVAFDILGQDQLIQKPRNLYDAWVGSIITPLTKLAKQDIEIFENIAQKEHHKDIKTLRLEWADLVPADHWPKVMDWSHSNMSVLFEVGYKAGQRFFERHGEHLTLKSDKAAKRPFCGKGSVFQTHPHPSAYRHPANTDSKNGKRGGTNAKASAGNSA
jgi:predicted acylesterase/phospholipase RssA